MKTWISKLSLTLTVFGVVFTAGCSSDVQGQVQAEDSKPNIVFFLADDQGWNDLSVQMDDDIPGSKSDYHRTPNIERIANSGMRFSNAYAAAPMCNPSRRSLHVGMGAARAAYAENSDEIQAQAMKLGQMMQSAGYATAHFGKWAPGPPAEGLEFYDESDGPKTNRDGNVADPSNPKDIFGITERAIAFIEASVSEGRPFYIQLSHFAPHMRIQALEDSVEAWQSIEPGEVHTNPAYAAMVENLDTGVGAVLDKLRELGVEDNTYVIYTSDHGQTINASSNLPLTLGKGTLWEGGMRVPFIVSGPGIASGASSDVRIVSTDLFPTFAELARVTASLPDDLDGGSLVPFFHGRSEGAVRRPREDLIFHFAQPSGQPSSRGSSSIYLDEYKLLKFYDTGELMLFDIGEDPFEQNNLADEMPERLEDMHVRLTDYLDEVGAIIPDPEAARGGMGMGGGGMGMGAF